MTVPNPLDLAKLRAELNTIAEYLQAGGSPEEILATLQDLAQGTPPEEEPGESNEDPGETPPEDPPADPPGGDTVTDAGK